MRTARKLSEANIYHVMGRGVGSQIIFEDDHDRSKLLELMKECLLAEGDVLAWCFMDNHFHVLVKLEMGFLSSAMRRMLSEYALFFNVRHGRCGHLFQDRFVSEPVNTDEYLLTVVRYIHRNPVKAGISATCDYRWSSYSDYIAECGMCSTNLVLSMLGSVEEFVRFHSVDGRESCMDVSPYHRRVDDDQAVAIARRVLGENPATTVAAFDKNARDKALRNLRDRGLTIGQIQRITGVGRGIIQRA